MYPASTQHEEPPFDPNEGQTLVWVQPASIPLAFVQSYAYWGPDMNWLCHACSTINTEMPRECPVYTANNHSASSLVDEVMLPRCCGCGERGPCNECWVTIASDQQLVGQMAGVPVDIPQLSGPGPYSAGAQDRHAAASGVDPLIEAMGNLGLTDKKIIKGSATLAMRAFKFVGGWFGSHQSSRRGKYREQHRVPAGMRAEPSRPLRRQKDYHHDDRERSWAQSSASGWPGPSGSSVPSWEDYTYTTGQYADYYQPPHAPSSHRPRAPYQDSAYGQTSSSRGVPPDASWHRQPSWNSSARYEEMSRSAQVPDGYWTASQSSSAAPSEAGSYRHVRSHRSHGQDGPHSRDPYGTGSSRHSNGQHSRKHHQNRRHDEHGSRKRQHRSKNKR